MRGSATEYEPITLPGGEDRATAEAGARRAVHPAAAVFPMMSAAELDDLAADIKANGQVHPIVCDADGQLIDGRNRLAACELAGVKPRFSTLPPGVDPVAFILSCNVQRRQLSKGQRAVAIVRAKLFAERTVWGGASQAAKALDISQTGISLAMTVMEHTPDLAELVMSGAMSLNAAYVIAREAKAKAEGRNLAAERAAADLRRLQVEAADLAERAAADLRRLQVEAPDLADHVVEESLTLNEALAALKGRRRQPRSGERASTAGGVSRSGRRPRVAHDAAERCNETCTVRMWHCVRCGRDCVITK